MSGCGRHYVDFIAEKMKILFICSECPYPADNGIRIPAWNFIKSLHKSHDVYLVVFSRVSDEQKQFCRCEAEKMCSKVEFIQRRGNDRKTKLFRFLTSATPHFVDEPLDASFARRFADVVKEFDPDVVHFDTLQTGEYGKLVHGIKATVISPNDSLSLALEDELRWNIHKSFMRRIYTGMFLKKVRCYEKELFGRFNRCHVVSQVDGNYLTSLNPDIRVSVIANGVDTDYFTPRERKPEPKTALFVGSLKRGNGIYMQIFIENVWKKVMGRHPDAKLYLAGKDITPKIAKLSEQVGGIFHLGFVEDLREVYAKSLVVVNPVLKSCGILNKVLEAMAMGCGVVGMRVGFSGIPECINQQHAVMTESFADMVNAFDELFSDQKLADTIGRAGRTLVENHYAWKSRSRRIEALYSDAIIDFQRRSI